MSSGGGAGPLVPTYHGFVNNSMDGLMLFEACLSGKLHHVPRRPHDRERASLIKSGSIFIYEENASGIKRWTDGVAWSPSRILGNFLIYRELDKPFPPGEKKRAMKRKRTSMPGEPFRPDSDETDAGEQTTPITPPTQSVSAEIKSELPSNEQDKEMERTLIGSLVDSYGFRNDGLVKKTMSISVNGISHHMVSYYKVEDVKNNVLPRPATEPLLQGMQVRPDLYLKQNFRAPVEDTEHYAIDSHMHPHPQMLYSMPGAPYGVRPGQYIGGQQYPSVYGMTSSASSPYGALTGTSWPTQQPSTSGVAYTGQNTYANPSYNGYYKAPNQPGAVKTEDQETSSQSMQYGTQYTPTYPNMQRSGSQSTPTMAQSAYQTPVQQSPSTFGSMSSMPSYGGKTMASPTTNGQAHSAYGGAPTQQYAVRSPTHPYGAHGGPNSAISHSPLPVAKSPNPGAPVSAPANDISYRSASYAVGNAPQPGSTNGDMRGLGINSSSPYPGQGHQGQSYPGYGPSGHPYRSSS